MSRLSLLTCSGAVIIAMSNTFRLDSTSFRRTLDRPSCNEVGVINFERVHAVSRLPCHDTPRPLRSGFDSNLHRRRREEIYDRLRDDSAERSDSASTTTSRPSRQPPTRGPNTRIRGREQRDHRLRHDDGEGSDSGGQDNIKTTAYRLKYSNTRIMGQGTERP